MATDRSNVAVLKPEDITSSTLRKLFEKFDEFGVTVSDDEDGLIELQGASQFYCYISSDFHRFGLMSAYSTSAGASLGEKLMYVNKINVEFSMIRAYVTNNGGIAFDYHMLISAGIPVLNLVYFVSEFDKLLAEAFEKDVRGIFEKS